MHRKVTSTGSDSWHHLRMHVFLVGGLASPPGSPARDDERARLRDYAGRLGAALAQAGHTLLICSPFPDSFDEATLDGAASVATGKGATHIEIHYLAVPGAAEMVESTKNRFGQLRFSVFQYPGPQGDTLGEGSNSEMVRVAWLLPQIRAMDRAFLTIALGGRSDGPASLLLQLAAARGKVLVPLPILGGAAKQAFDRQQHDLATQWGTDFSHLEDPARLKDVVTKLDTIASGKPPSAVAGSSRALQFFISYPRARPAEADFVEALLRRQSQLDVHIIRDERQFEVGTEIDKQIEEYIRRADVFIAIWSREYACSPWCYDELETALERQAAGLLLWIVLVDDTRMVPKRARNLLHLVGRTRDEIEAKLLAQLGRLLEDRGIKGPLSHARMRR